MQQFLLVLHVFISLALIILILLQQGKGAEMGASFGAGASQTLFGSRGSGSFFLRLTGIFAFLFFANCILLGIVAAHQSKSDIIQNLNNMPVKSAPAVPASHSDSSPASSDSDLSPLQKAQDEVDADKKIRKDEGYRNAIQLQMQ